MATGYGGWISGDDWRAVVVASVDYSADSTKATAKVTVTGKLENVYAQSSSGGSAWTGAISSSSSGTTSTSFSGFSTNQTVTIKSHSFTVDRGSDDKTITVRCAVTSPSSSIYGTQTSTATVTLTISARPSYTISYNANGGSGAPSSQTKYYGKALTLSSTTPTKSGYTFSKWHATGDHEGYYDPGDSYTANASSTLWAVWVARTYLVQYNANGGSGAPNSQWKTYGETLKLSTTKPTRTGYTFKGWATSSSGSVAYASGANYTANAAVTLYAVWQIKTYTVTYDANGGSGAPSAQTKTHGKALTLSSTKPTRTGYDFGSDDGYWHASGGTTAWFDPGDTLPASVNANVTLYASWTLKTYTVSYNANGGSDAPSSHKKTHGTALTLKGWNNDAPTRTGHTFLGWSTSSSATSATYTSSSHSYTANAAVTLYAVWKKNTYTVQFKGNKPPGASGTVSNVPSDQTKTYGTALTLSSTKPTLTGYTFKGWNTNSGGTGTTYQPGGSYTANSGTTLHAVWQVITYTVSYDANGGSSTPASQPKAHGTDLTLRGAITRADATVAYAVTYDENGGSVSPTSATAKRVTKYTFQKWKSTAGDLYDAGGSYDKDVATTMTAQWTSSTTPATVTLPTPTRTNYTFSGWYTEATGGTRVGGGGSSYMVTEPITLHAQWVDQYEPPALGGLTAKRCLQDGTDDDEGTYCKCELRWAAGDKAVTSVTFSATYGTTSESVTVSSPTASPVTAVFGGGNLSTSTRYTITATLTDGSTTLKKTTVLTPAFFTLDFLAGGKGMGIGQAVSQEGLWVNMLTTIWSGLGVGIAAAANTLKVAVPAAFTSTLSAVTATVSGLLTADRMKIANGGTKGLLTEDSTGFEYPLISDNGSNLWIGAHKAGEQHHTGGTYISAGAGRDTIYVSVPNSDNTAATNYTVMHSGYAPTETTTISDIISAQTNVTVSAASFAQWGKVAMLNVAYTLSSEISVPANGNASNTALFTIAAGKRPAMTLGVILDNNEGAWGTVSAGGVVTLAGANSRGSAWTMNTTSNRYLQICYLLP